MVDIGIHGVESVVVRDDSTADGTTKWTELLIRKTDGQRVKVTLFPAGEMHATITRKVEATV